MYGFVLASPISTASPVNGANWFCITTNASRISAWFSLFPSVVCGNQENGWYLIWIRTSSRYLIFEKTDSDSFCRYAFKTGDK